MMLFRCIEEIFMEKGYLIAHLRVNDKEGNVAVCPFFTS